MVSSLPEVKQKLGLQKSPIEFVKLYPQVISPIFRIHKNLKKNIENKKIFFRDFIIFIFKIFLEDYTIFIF